MIEDMSKKISIGEKVYIIQVCSAQQQWDILNLFFKYGLSSALYQLSVGESAFVASAIFGSFSEKASDDEREHVTATLLNGCIEKGSKLPVDIDDFHSQMFNYISLHVEALKFNFADFLPFLQSSEQEGSKTENPSQKGEMSQL